MDNKEKELRRRQEDQALNRGLCWAGGAVVMEVLLVLLRRYYINPYVDSLSVKIMVTLDNILRGICTAAPVAVVLCLLWAVLQLKKGRGCGLPAVFGVIALVLWTSAHVVRYFREVGLQMMLLLVPILAGLALVYYIYQKEFFLAALGAGLAGLGLWFYRYREKFTVELGLIMGGILVILAFTLLLKKNDGMVCVKKQIVFLPKGVAYAPVFVSLGVGLAALLVSLAMGATAAYYLMFFMVVWLFVLLVYYTVKLM